MRVASRLSWVRLGAALLAAGCLCGPATAQGDAKPTATLKLEVGSVAEPTITGVVTLAFAPGLHGYQNPPAQDYQIPVTIKGGPGVSLIRATYPKGQPMRMAGESRDSMVYAGSVKIPVVLKVSSGPTRNVSVVIEYQQCNETSCFPPASVTASCLFQTAIRHPVPKPAVRVTGVAGTQLRHPVRKPAVRVTGMVRVKRSLHRKRSVRVSHHRHKARRRGRHVLKHGK